MRTFKKASVLVLLVLLVIGGCKKDKKNDPSTTTPPTTTPANPTGAFEFHLHTYLDNNEVDAYSIVYTTDAGRKISLSLAQLYVSNIQLIKADGSTVDFAGKKILKVLNQATYLVGNAPVGNYKSIRFSIGFDAATNQLSPTAAADSAVLNKPQMWFDASPQPNGYVFMNVQGKIDTTSDASGTVAQMQPFVYKIGTNNNYKQITMPDKPFTIVQDQVEFGHIIIDFNKLFAGITLYQAANLSVTDAASNNIAPATKVAANIPLMFRYEE